VKRKILVCSMLFLILFGGNTVFAYNTLGGKQKTTSITVVIKSGTKTTYTNGNYTTDIALGAGNWNATPTKLNLYPVLGGGGHIYVGGDYFGNIGWNAQNTNYREFIWFGDYDSSVIDLNYDAMDSRSSLYNSSTITHEIGHSLGLDHVSDNSQIMSTYGNPTRTTYTPGTDDVDGINYLYP